MAGARSESGEITAVQITFLNAHTAAKADLHVAKRSFGIVKGSAVTLQETQGANILFVAEGVETALSLKSVGIQGTIKASLGLSNIKRIVPESPLTHIVICADHDAPNSPAVKNLEKSVTSLQERGLAVTVIKPDKLMQDFNDVLKTQGPQGVREVLERNLPKDLIKFAIHKKEASQKVPIFEKHGVEKKTIEESPPAISQKAERKTTSLGRDLLTQDCPKEKVLSMDGTAIFEELTKQCIQKLCAYLGEKRPNLTTERITRANQQAEKAANFIFHAHTLKWTRPTEKETEHFLLRAKYELDRIPEIRQDLIYKWQKAGSYKEESDELIAHIIAEHQAAIEGRMYLEAKQKGYQPLLIIPDLAAKEIQTHRATTEILAQKFASKHGLSERATTYCAKDILRHQETHGEKPSSEQMAIMVQISREIDKQGYQPSMGSHNIEYFRRRDGDLRFRELASAGKDLSGFNNFPHKSQTYSDNDFQTRVKPYGVESYRDAKPDRVIEGNAKAYEMELSL